MHGQHAGRLPSLQAINTTLSPIWQMAQATMSLARSTHLLCSEMIVGVWKNYCQSMEECSIRAQLETVCNAGDGDPQQDHLPACCGRRGAERPGFPAPPRQRWPVMRPLVMLRLHVCRFPADHRCRCWGSESAMCPPISVIQRRSCCGLYGFRHPCAVRKRFA